MSKVEEIQIERLSEDERQTFREWFADFDAQVGISNLRLTQRREGWAASAIARFVIALPGVGEIVNHHASA